MAIAEESRSENRHFAVEFAGSPVEKWPRSMAQSRPKIPIVGRHRQISADGEAIEQACRHIDSVHAAERLPPRNRVDFDHVTMACAIV